MPDRPDLLSTGEVEHVAAMPIAPESRTLAVEVLLAREVIRTLTDAWSLLYDGDKEWGFYTGAHGDDWNALPAHLSAYLDALEATDE